MFKYLMKKKKKCLESINFNVRKLQPRSIGLSKPCHGGLLNIITVNVVLSSKVNDVTVFLAGFFSFWFILSVIKTIKLKDRRCKEDMGV
jgi:hypothetical protein